MILCCTIAIDHLPIHLFKTPWSTRNVLCLNHFYSLFSFQNLLDIVTVKKHFLSSVIYFILLDTCPRITSRWYKTILNQADRTCKVKKQKNKINNFWQLHIIANLYEFRRVNNSTPETVNIYSRRVMHHAPLLFYYNDWYMYYYFEMKMKQDISKTI